MSDHEIIVIGAGQAGLAAGRELKLKNADFTTLDAGVKSGGSWRNYYDSLVLFSPARYSSLPGLSLPGDPAKYPARDEVIEYLSDYAGHFDLPIETDKAVSAVEFETDHYHLTLADGTTRTSRGLIVATGAFGSPQLPALAGQNSFCGNILHSSTYRIPQPFAGQNVIVVGAGNSAVQIAVELAEHANVTLAVRDNVKFLPQRIMGQDLHWWFEKLRLNGTNLFSDHGVPVIDDGHYRTALRRGKPEVRPMFLSFTDHGVTWPDGSEEAIDTVLFATGFRPSLAFLNGIGALDDQMRPLHRRGVSTRLPHLGYVGLSGQNGFASATLRGVGRDASTVVSSILA